MNRCKDCGLYTTYKPYCANCGFNREMEAIAKMPKEEIGKRQPGETCSYERQVNGS